MNLVFSVLVFSVLVAMNMRKVEILMHRVQCRRQRSCPSYVPVPPKYLYQEACRTL